MDDLPIDIRYLLGVARRRWWLMVIPTVFGGMLAGLIAYVLPPTYVSEARLLVVSPEIPTELARSTVNLSVNAAVNQIRQRLTTRNNLLDVAGRLNVFPDQSGMTPTEIVQRMRQATTIRPRGGNVQVGFKSSDPQIAARVANDFLTQLLEQNAAQRSALAANTLDFFSSEVDRLGGEIRDMEARISRFQAENRDVLPNTLDFRRDTLQEQRRQVQARAERRDRLEERRRELRDAITENRLDALLDLDTPETQELRNLRAALVRQGALYAPTHPTMRRLEAQIAAIEQMRRQQFSEAIAEQGVTDPVQLALRRANEELAEIEARLAEMAEADAEAETRIAELEASIEQTPAAAIALRSLNRDYDTLQLQYRQAIERQATAATGERIEVNQQAQRLEVIEQPQVPERPESPNRPLIAAAGIVVSGGFGFGLIVLAELLNRSVRTSRQIERRLEMRPIVAIPYIWTDSQRWRRRWLPRAAAALIVFAVPIGLFAVDRFYLPLPVLAERVIERSGMERVLTMIDARFGRGAAALGRAG